MIFTLTLPLSATDYPDPPEVYIVHVALSPTVGVLPYFGALTGQDSRFLIPNYSSDFCNHAPLLRNLVQD